MSGLGNPDDDVIQAMVFVENHVELVRSQIPSGVSASHCRDCHTIIPLARREAQQGCQYCIDCQENHDALPKIKTVTKML